MKRIMDYVQRFQIANLQLELDPVGPVTVVILPQLFFLMA